MTILLLYYFKLQTKWIILPYFCLCLFFLSASVVSKNGNFIISHISKISPAQPEFFFFLASWTKHTQRSPLLFMCMWEESRRMRFISSRNSGMSPCSPGSSAAAPLCSWHRVCVQVLVWYGRQRDNAPPGVAKLSSLLSRTDGHSPANNHTHSEDLSTVNRKSLALLHLFVTGISNPSVPTSSLTTNLICCLYSPPRQLPLQQAHMSLSSVL